MLPLARGLELLGIRAALAALLRLDPTVLDDKTIELGEAGLTWRSGRWRLFGLLAARQVTHTVSWARIETIRETDEQFVFRAAAHVYFLPKSALPAEQLPEVRAFLRRYAGRAGHHFGKHL